MLVGVLELIRRHMFREKYAMLWLVLAAIIASIPWMYPVYVRMGRLVGIKSEMTTFFFGGIVILLLLSLQFTLALTTAYRQRKRLAQKIALLEGRIIELQSKLDDKNSSANKENTDE